MVPLLFGDLFFDGRFPQIGFIYVKYLSPQTVKIKIAAYDGSSLPEPAHVFLKLADGSVVDVWVRDTAEVELEYPPIEIVKVLYSGFDAKPQKFLVPATDIELELRVYPVRAIAVDELGDRVDGVIGL